MEHGIGKTNKQTKNYLKTEISIMDKDSIMIKWQQKLIQLSIIASVQFYKIIYFENKLNKTSLKKPSNASSSS